MSATDSSDDMALEQTFQKKLREFAADLIGTFPELEAAVQVVVAMPVGEAIRLYAKDVMTKHAPHAKEMPCPGVVLPGVIITEELWNSVGAKTKAVVYDYLSIMDLSALYTCGFEGLGDGEGAEGAEGAAGFSKEWADRVMRDWRGRMDRVDFEGMAGKFSKLFGGDGSALPPLPEKFLKGKLAKLAEDMVREFKPEDFGLRPEDLAAVEKDPTRAFEILMQASGANPAILQKALARVAKKLQEKVASGQLKPQELVAEAEELMKEFQSHPAFVEMMESFRSAFSFDDTETAQAAGRDGENRLSIARARLRKKLEAKKGGKGGAAGGGGK
jgi:hypothetical protein